MAKTMDQQGLGLEAELTPAPWQARTKHGYALDDVVSALQKTIRRSQIDETLFWTHELNISGYGAYAWRRLFVICSEDIGMADPQAAIHTAALHAMSLVLLANRKTEKDAPKVFPELQLMQAAYYLARAPKNREMADAICTIELRMHRDQLIEIPDVARDQHTGAGKRMGRGMIHFMEEGRVVTPEADVDGNVWQQRWFAEWEPDTANPSSRLLWGKEPARDPDE